jgi:hypothetical protein
MSPKDIEAKITSKTRLIIINSPQNPTGSIMTKDELKQVYKIAKTYGIKGVSIKNYPKLDDKLEEILHFEGPVICDVLVPRAQEIIPTVSSRVNQDGTMSSRSLEDMYQFLERGEYKKNLYIDEV